MEELYVENFFKNEKKTPPKIETSAERVEHTSIEVLEISHQMIAILDKLERNLQEDFADFTGLHFVFEKIRNEIKQRKTDSLQTSIGRLEELVDLGLPSLELKRQMGVS